MAATLPPQWISETFLAADGDTSRAVSWTPAGTGGKVTTYAITVPHAITSDGQVISAHLEDVTDGGATLVISAPANCVVTFAVHKIGN